MILEVHQKFLRVHEKGVLSMSLRYRLLGFRPDSTVTGRGRVGH